MPIRLQVLQQTFQDQEEDHHIMVDGDPQQEAEIFSAMRSYMPNAHLSHCGWHIVFQGWKRHAPTNTSVSKAGKDRFTDFKKQVTNWCYSFMTPGRVETIEEFALSKELFFSYLNGSQALEACESTHIKELVVKFIRDYFFVRSNHFWTKSKTRVANFGGLVPCTRCLPLNILRSLFLSKRCTYTRIQLPTGTFLSLRPC